MTIALSYALGGLVPLAVVVALSTGLILMASGFKRIPLAELLAGISTAAASSIAPLLVPAVARPGFAEPLVVVAVILSGLLGAAAAWFARHRSIDGIRLAAVVVALELAGYVAGLAVFLLTHPTRGVG